MNKNIISYALTAYAVYSAIANKRKLDEQIDRIVDIESDVDSLSSDVAETLKTTRTLLEQDLQVSYTFICGRPTDMNKLSGSIHFSIHNKSDKRTYIAKGIMFTPILGTTFANASSQSLFNLYWSAGKQIPPGATLNGRIAYNNLKLKDDVFAEVYGTIDHKFRAAEGWDKLRDKYAQIENGCSSDVWVLANAPYVDAAHDYVIEKKGLPGVLYWHGGNYWPGSTDKYQGKILNFREAEEVFL